MCLTCNGRTRAKSHTSPWSIEGKPLVPQGTSRPLRDASYTPCPAIRGSRARAQRTWRRDPPQRKSRRRTQHWRLRPRSQKAGEVRRPSRWGEGVDSSLTRQARKNQSKSHTTYLGTRNWDGDRDLDRALWMWSIGTAVSVTTNAPKGSFAALRLVFSGRVALIHFAAGL